MYDRPNINISLQEGYLYFGDLDLTRDMLTSFDDHLCLLHLLNRRGRPGMVNDMESCTLGSSS